MDSTEIPLALPHIRISGPQREASWDPETFRKTNQEFGFRHIPPNPNHRAIESLERLIASKTRNLT